MADGGGGQLRGVLEERAGRSREPSLGVVLEFMRLIWGLDHNLQSRSKRIQQTLGITGPQRLVLRILGRMPGLTPGDLAHILHLHPSTLTGVLERLERRGLIVRRPDPADGRRSHLSLTPRGQELDAVRSGTVEQAMSRALGTLPRGKVRAAMDVLATVSDTLAEDVVPASSRPRRTRPRGRPRG